MKKIPKENAPVEDPIRRLLDDPSILDVMHPEEKNQVESMAGFLRDIVSPAIKRQNKNARERLKRRLSH